MLTFFRDKNLLVDVKEVTKVTNSPLRDSKGKKDKRCSKGNKKELLSGS